MRRTLSVSTTLPPLLSQPLKKTLNGKTMQLLTDCMKRDPGEMVDLHDWQALPSFTMGRRRTRGRTTTTERRSVSLPTPPLNVIYCHRPLTHIGDILNKEDGTVLISEDYATILFKLYDMIFCLVDDGLKPGVTFNRRYNTEMDVWCNNYINRIAIDLKHDRGGDLHLSLTGKESISDLLHKRHATSYTNVFDVQLVETNSCMGSPHFFILTEKTVNRSCIILRFLHTRKEYAVYEKILLTKFMCIKLVATYYGLPFSDILPLLFGGDKWQMWMITEAEGKTKMSHKRWD
jgi:hypothetical protein